MNKLETAAKAIQKRLASKVSHADKTNAITLFKLYKHLEYK